MQDFLSALPGISISIAGAIIGFFIGTAFAPLVSPTTINGTSLRTAFREADAATNWGVARWIKANFGSTSNSSTTTDGDKIMFALVSIAIAVWLYVRWVEVVAYTLIVMSALVVLAATISIWVLWRRGAVDGKVTAYRIVGGALLATVGTINAVWTMNPPTHTDAMSRLQASLIHGHDVASDGGESYGFILFQLLGVVVTVATLLAAIAFGVASVSAIYIKQRSVGAWFWRFCFWASKWTVPVAVSIVFFVLGLFSLVLTGGFFFDWIQALSA